MKSSDNHISCFMLVDSPIRVRTKIVNKRRKLQPFVPRQPQSSPPKKGKADLKDSVGEKVLVDSNNGSQIAIIGPQAEVKDHNSILVQYYCPMEIYYRQSIMILFESGFALNGKHVTRRDPRKSNSFEL